MNLPIYRSNHTVSALKIKSVKYIGGLKGYVEIGFENEEYPDIRMPLEWGNDNLPRSGDYLVEDQKKKITCYEGNAFDKSFSRILI